MQLVYLMPLVSSGIFTAPASLQCPQPWQRIHPHSALQPIPFIYLLPRDLLLLAATSIMQARTAELIEQALNHAASKTLYTVRAHNRHYAQYFQQ